MASQGSSIVAIIPARRGSKRLPGKNVRSFGGRPLVAWTLEAAVGAATLDRAVLTTDDPIAAALGRDYADVEVFDRPTHLADDRARNPDVMRDVVGRLDEVPEYLVLLQPTCPLRGPDDIDAAVRHCIASGASSCISVSRPAKSSHWLFRAEAGRLAPLLARDTVADIRLPGPSVFVPNGAVFVVRGDVLMGGGDYYTGQPAYYEMPRERSVDIDDELDLLMAEAALAWLRRGAA